MLAAIDPTAVYEWSHPEDTAPVTVFRYRVLTARERARVVQHMQAGEGDAVTIHPEAADAALMAGLIGWEHFSGPAFGADQRANVDTLPVEAYMGLARAIIERSFLTEGDRGN